MRSRVQLFAVARERAGASEVLIDLPEGATVADVREALVALPGLAGIVPTAMIAVRAEYAADSQAVADGDELALIPPVSGGAA